VVVLILESGCWRCAPRLSRGFLGGGRAASARTAAAVGPLCEFGSTLAVSMFLWLFLSLRHRKRGARGAQRIGWCQGRCDRIQFSELRGASRWMGARLHACCCPPLRRARGVYVATPRRGALSGPSLSRILAHAGKTALSQGGYAPRDALGVPASRAQRPGSSGSSGGEGWT
jgi:hypothetical protein